MTTLALTTIRTDGGTQARAGLNEDTINDYADHLRDGAAAFPPLIVFYDGNDYWLADGFHRLAAAHAAGLESFACTVHQGTQREAVLYACGANADHGLRRTNGDKERAVTTLLRDPEWRKWSDREIARRCGVTHPLVARLRKDLGFTAPDERLVQRGDQVFTQKQKPRATAVESPPVDALSPEDGGSTDADLMGEVIATLDQPPPGVSAPPRAAPSVVLTPLGPAPQAAPAVVLTPMAPAPPTNTTNYQMQCAAVRLKLVRALTALAQKDLDALQSIFFDLGSEPEVYIDATLITEAAAHVYTNPSLTTQIALLTNASTITIHDARDLLDVIDERQ